MADRNETSGSLARKRNQEVIVIEARERLEAARLRVAAYARVSTDSGDQLNSFAAQSRYFTTLISGNDDWSLVDVYADEGVTGTSAQKREDFQRLMMDCRRGLIDKVLTKSVSRFARNTKECLQAIRELKALGIGVYFEEQRVDTARISGELLTTIFASLAQEESQSISNKTRWSLEQRMRNGSFNTCTAPFGFRLIDGKLHVVEKEAEIVRDIFAAYLNGETARFIARRLNASGAGDLKWQARRIDYILKNERYAGNALLQKRYTTVGLPRALKYNRGERKMYFVQGSNEAIISQETFDRAQALRKRRGKNTCAQPWPLSGKMICGHCGKALRKKQINGKLYVTCRTHEESLELCPVTQIPEAEVLDKFCLVYYQLKHYGEPILRQMLSHLREIQKKRLLWDEEAIALNNRISELIDQNQLLTKLNQQGLVDSDIFISSSNELAEQLRAAKLAKERLMLAASDETAAKTRAMLEALQDGPDYLDVLDEALFEELVEAIVLENDGYLIFRLVNGLELREAVERTGW